MQNRLRLESSVGCGWFMVCWNASCGYNVNRKSLNGDPLWLLCWLRPLDRDGQHAQRPEPATVASSNGLGHTARIKTKHLTIWQGLTFCLPGPARWSVDRKLKSIGEHLHLSQHISVQQCILNVSVHGPRKDLCSLSTTRRISFQLHQCWGGLKTLFNVPNNDLVTPRSKTLKTKF